MEFTEIIWTDNYWQEIKFDGKYYDLDCLVMDISRWIFEQFIITNKKTSQVISWIKKIVSASLEKN